MHRTLHPHFLHTISTMHSTASLCENLIKIRRNKNKSFENLKIENLIFEKMKCILKWNIGLFVDWKIIIYLLIAACLWLQTYRANHLAIKATQYSWGHHDTALLLSKSHWISVYWIYRYFGTKRQSIHMTILYNLQAPCMRVVMEVWTIHTLRMYDFCAIAFDSWRFLCKKFAYNRNMHV